MQNKSALVNFRDEAETVMLNDFLLELPSKRKFKDSGQMIAPATIARVGIMEYRAGECGALFADREPNSLVKIMTTAESLYDAASIESYRSTPITIGHPTEDVTVENSKELQKGHLEGQPFRDEDGEHLSGTIVLTDIDAINAVETGAQQLSSGHTCMLKLADAGSDWDAEKIDIRANHIAIVGLGRAASATIADEKLDVKTLSLNEVELKHKMEPGSLKDALAKGVAVESEHTTDASIAEEIALDHLAESPDYYTELAVAEAKMGDDMKMFDQAHVDTMQAKLDTQAEQLVLKDAEIVALQDKTSDEAIASIVSNRVEFLAKATKFSDKDLVSMTEQEAKLLILKDSLGKDFNDKSEAYINARYDVLLEDGLDEEENSIAAALIDHAKNDTKVEVKQSENITARQKMIARNNKS